MKYSFIAQHAREYPVKRMCQALGVSDSGYYAWKRRPPSQRQQADEVLAERIRQIHQASHRIYGSRRIRAELDEQGQPCGRKRVVRLMRHLGLSSRRRPHRTITTDSQHTDPLADNLLNRDFSAPTPTWCAGVRELPDRGERSHPPGHRQGQRPRKCFAR
jgi:putative transposase